MIILGQQTTDGDANAAAQAILAVYEGADAAQYARETRALAVQVEGPGSAAALFWQDVETLLRLETASDETVEQAEQRWAIEGAMPDEVRAWWMGAADVLGRSDAHVREYLIHTMDPLELGIGMANSSWWNREGAEQQG